MKPTISAPRRFRPAAPRRWKASFSVPVAILVLAVASPPFGWLGDR